MDIWARLKAAKTRIPKLVDKYPVVAGLMFIAGLVVGLVLMVIFG